MSRHPAPTREHHDDFCLTEKWTLVRGATGKPVRHHKTFELPLHDGRILRTRISKPVNRTAYGASIWAEILRSQLCVESSVFWACVQDGVLPDRGRPAAPASGGLPLSLMTQLVRTVGLEPSAAVRLSVAEATAAIAEHWARVSDEH
ncbi:cytotoxic translational repressor of toxin-antitoxin stability system [Rathayibacter festucae]|uniref:Cytotoxic translational repressor of toxin-antitoxin stability system n=1 Tax=Rathayibacter festucae DSM 15932 TaxID=1328866 RepID=A0A3T0T5A4_9MICO|nr:cytotoxic translational repressor of toxin-antitoxin stability system [Rathayibacter festucae]AZZ53824.1 cytotoxic translational repressor of toxin-antitoxin stability system [Rathayibacter festucae DSM 15932]